LDELFILLFLFVVILNLGLNIEEAISRRFLLTPQLLLC
jgi:hypothetical protein